MHYPPPIHGAAIVGDYIKNSLLLQSSFQSKYLNLGTSQNIQEIGSGGMVKILRFLKLLLRVGKHQLVYKPDLVYLSPAVYPNGIYKDFLVSSLVKILGGNVVYHLHNKGVAKHQNKKFLGVLYTYFFKSTKVILVSRALYNDIKKYVREDQVYYCPNGIPPVAEIERFTKSKNKSSSKPKLLFLSNLFEAKGPLVLLEALAILKDQQIDFFCNFIGGEGDISRAGFKQQVEAYGLQNNVNYLGSLYGDQKHEALANADIFVFPTHYETFGLVNLEAMQFGLPVVSTREGAIPDVIVDGKTGLLAEPKDAPKLARHLKQLIENKTMREAMGNAGKQRYKEKYTLAKFEKNINKILEELTV